VIVEPVPANYGLLVQRHAWLEHVAARCRNASALLIFDEVITGFRSGVQGAAGTFGFRPDLVCYGKIIGGGFPVGAYGGRADLMNLVAPAGPVYRLEHSARIRRHARRSRDAGSDGEAGRLECARAACGSIPPVAVGRFSKRA
jgi:hypothetical protein